MFVLIIINSLTFSRIPNINSNNNYSYKDKVYKNYTKKNAILIKNYSMTARQQERFIEFNNTHYRILL